jgi:GNAT superfamily N-acetyltransferase
MSGSTAEFEIDQVSLPENVDAPDAGDFVRANDVANVTETITFGTPDIVYEAGEVLAHWRDPHTPFTMFVARVDGEIVARATIETNAGETDTSWLMVQVLPEFRGRGIGTALAERVEQKMRDEGKKKAISYVGGTDLSGDRLTSPTGFGSIATESRETRFMQSRGYRFEQVERLSRLPLPMTGLDEKLRDAVAASGPEYVVHTWERRIPERWIADMALLITRMSTDAPSAGLEEPEDVWTPERLAEHDERIAREQPRTRLTAAAEHVPSGELVAFTDLSVPPQSHRAAMQYATLVRREHRGHKLGMLVKVANLVQFATNYPGYPSILTFNAEENRHMLDVNEELGFVPIAYEGAWRKDL